MGDPLSKIMFVKVTAGVAGNYVFTPMYKIAEVNDEKEFLGHLRARILKKTLSEARGENVEHILNTLKIKLHDTGLTEYPDTPEAEALLFERMTQWENPDQLRLTNAC
jgi:hypothetical protein